MKNDKEVYVPAQEVKVTIEGHKVLMGQFWADNREKFETQAQVNVILKGLPKTEKSFRKELTDIIYKKFIEHVGL